MKHKIYLYLCFFSIIIFFQNRNFLDLIFLLITSFILGFIQYIKGRLIEADDFEILLALFAFVSMVFMRVIIDPPYMLAHIIEVYGPLYLLGETNRLIFLFGGEYVVGFSAIGLLADGYINLGIWGIIVTSIWFSFLLILSEVLLITKPNLILKFLIYVAMVSFFYSNIFSSAIPLILLFVVLFLLC